jgi:hypothetical protein
MAETNALVSIEDAIARYLLKYKKPITDYVVYLENALDCFREFRINDAKEARSEKVAVDALGIIEMPDDMISFKDVCVARNGEWWSMTMRQDMVNTTTMVGIVETQDTTFGEGVALQDNLIDGYGARGAVNTYYYMLDWKARRIFCDGIKSDTVLLKYVSSGISLTGTTYIPEDLIETMDNYLLFKETYWIPSLIRERAMREQGYINAKAKLRVRLNSLTSSQWSDLFWGLFNQNPQR